MTSESTPATQVKCHPCRAKGMKRVEAYVSPDRKNQIKEYCKQRGISEAGLINTLLYNALTGHS